MNPDTCPNYFKGYRILTTSALVEQDGYDKTKRSWKERLFTRPWRPKVKYNHKARYKPSKEIVFDDKHMLMYIHPETAKELMRAIDDNKNNNIGNSINNSNN